MKNKIDQIKAVKHVGHNIIFTKFMYPFHKNKAKN
jgi:hypothetical protein